MPTVDIKKIKTLDGELHDIHDETARAALANKADKNNLVATGSISIGRLTGSAIGANSVAEGTSVSATGASSHAEGGNTIASGVCSHAEGVNTTAAGNNSHVSGRYNVADSPSNLTEWVSGTSYSVGDVVKITSGSNITKYKCKTANSDTTFSSSKWFNLGSELKYAEIVGNGTYATYSNARTLDWEGNEWLAGDLTINGATGHPISLQTIAGNAESALPANLKGAANGIAELDSSGKVPASQLPSYVDDVIEANTSSAFPATGETGKIYVAVDTGKTYRWSGSTYIEISTVDITGKADKTDTVLNTTLSMGRKANTAIGSKSTALGDNVTASGEASHAEGYYTEATAAQSHAEGQATHATALNAHAEGVSSRASGQASHAEGDDTTASGARSHAEGASTIASGAQSHAEGSGAKATGSNSHAEGGATIAIGLCSHAEGSSTTASGNCSHAGGYGTTAIGSNSNVFGRFNLSDSFTNIPEWEANKSYHRNDIVKITTTENNVVTDRQKYICNVESSNSAQFVYSDWVNFNNELEFVEIVGNGVSALSKSNARTLDWNGNERISNSLTIGERAAGSEIGNNSLAVGSDVSATGSCATAEGGGTIASGNLSHAEGGGTTASGSQSHAEGASTLASGSQSHAEGIGGTYIKDGTTYTSEAKGIADHTEGYQTRTSAGQPGNHAEGYRTSAIGGASHAEGNMSTASGGASHAEGNDTKASGYGSHAEGSGTIASGNYAHAEGASTTASGAQSHSEGAGTTASGNYAHAEGSSTTASGAQSHAEGASTTASGEQSHSEGAGTTASGTYAHSEGSGTIAAGSSSHVSGKYNVADEEANLSDLEEWAPNTDYHVGDVRKRTVTSNGVTTVTKIICKEGNIDSSFNSSRWYSFTKEYKYAEIIGNGFADNHRSNARTLDWDGNERIAGDLYVHANQNGSGGSKVAKESDITDLVVVQDETPTNPNTRVWLTATASQGIQVPTYAEFQALETSVGGKVSDVQVNSTSVVTNGVANVPKATNEVLGVVKAYSYGIRVNSDGDLYINPASSTEVKAGVTNYTPIVAANQHQAAFYGLAKAAGDSTQAASDNAVGVYTSGAKSAIQAMLGVESAVSLVETVSGTTPSITCQPNVQYICGEVSTISITPPANGTCDVIFESGSTAAVLTLPNTVKMPAWFDESTLETDTIYEIVITNGVYGSVMTWES